MAIQKLISRLFASRDFAHKSHLNSDSYAQHQALGGFYDAIVPEADAFAEMWMGRNMERVGTIPTYESKTDGNPATILKRHLTEIEKMRDEVCGDCTALMNQFDNIVSVYLKTIYKLKFLE